MLRWPFIFTISLEIRLLARNIMQLNNSKTLLNLYTRGLNLKDPCGLLHIYSNVLLYSLDMILTATVIFPNIGS